MSFGANQKPLLNCVTAKQNDIESHTREFCSAVERFHSIPRDTIDKEQGRHVDVPNNRFVKRTPTWRP